MADAARDLWHQDTSERGGDPLWLAQPTDDIEVAFVAFHQANRGVYAELETRALTLGAFPTIRRIGIAQLFEAMRYDHALRTAGEDWKLNNNYRALYVRLLLHHQPHLAGKFELRARHPGKPCRVR